MNIFETIEKERGAVAEIYSAFAAFPDAVEGHYHFYKKIMLNSNLPLTRTEREYLAVQVSKANQCPYCISHHQAALDHHDETTLEPQRREVLQALAAMLSETPWKATVLRDRFLSVGYDDYQWQHAVMVASYFNMANRLVLSMGLELEPDYFRSCR